MSFSTSDEQELLTSLRAWMSGCHKVETEDTVSYHFPDETIIHKSYQNL